ncbi:MAG TPA: glycosyltransferase family 4 protein [Vicinamibacterales bacterium]|nr:glycosyltransferase family 4 protein [Vicinamibacterales bacterium]
MRVLHVAAGNLYGGVERILEEIARHAPAASRHEFALSFEGRLSAGLDAAGATRHDLGAVRFSRPLSVWRARRRLRRLVRANAYDAVVCHAPWALALAAPAVARGLTVLWAHDASRGDHWTERRAARKRPDLVICNSHYTADAIGAWLIGVPRQVVYAPVSPPAGNGLVRANMRRALGAGDRETVVLVASRLERWKGHAELLRSAVALRGLWKIWVAGAPQRPHEARYERELKALADSLGLRDRVTFLGERRDVPQLFRAADLHCQPNIMPEPFGLAFIEALYASIPVVTSDLGGAREIITPECGELVTPGDRQALTQTLQSLIDDPARRARLGSAGPARARALCDPSTQIAALERALA